MAAILVIDDDEDVRDIVAQVLEGAGHRVTTARNGREGLTSFRADRPDVVVTDIIMPDKEGIETIRDLRTIAPGTPIIAMSGGGRTGNMDFLEVATEFGATRVLRKPFESRDLLDMVSQVLG